MNRPVPLPRRVADVLQIPGIPLRQTDLLVACRQGQSPVNIRKGQWMAPEEMRGAVEKVREGGAPEVAVTSAATFFGYGDLVVDMRSFSRLRGRVQSARDLRRHALRAAAGQGSDGSSGGQRAFIPPLLYAAAAAGADGFFLETHPDPARAPSDGPNMVRWTSLRASSDSPWTSGSASGRPSCVNLRRRLSGLVDRAKRVLALEAAAVQALADNLGVAFARAIEILAGAKGRVIVSGVEKSGLIAHKIAATFTSTGHPGDVPASGGLAARRPGHRQPGRPSRSSCRRAAPPTSSSSRQSTQAARRADHRSNG